MVAILHAIITEIENYRISNNIQNWRVNTKIDNIREKHRIQVEWLKEQVCDYAENGDEPVLKELKLKVWNLCGDENQIYNPHHIDHHINKLDWYKEIKIPDLSSEFIFKAMGYICIATSALELDISLILEACNPRDLKPVLVYLMMKHKHLIDEMNDEVFEYEAKVEEEIKVAIDKIINK